jgi:hypothetical protein
MFVKELLCAAFYPLGIFLVPSLIGKPGHKGGNIRFDRLRIDVRNRLLGDRTAFCTTFLDFYGLPMDFPGKADAARHPEIKAKACCVQESMARELESQIDSDAMRRFIPYVQMHEFEALLFSAPKGLALGIGRSDLASHFQSIQDSFDSPEEIDDSPETAPSKRIKKAVAGYEKAIYGSLAALEIGLSIMRKECTLFDYWLKQLERLTKDGGRYE